MKSHETAIADKFNRASMTYDQHAVIQACIGENLIQSLCYFRSKFKHVIDAGCGTGYTTRLLANAISFADFDAIDIADLLLAQARESLADINYLSLSYDHIVQNADTDLIFSNMALHWSNSLVHTLKVFYNALDDQGLLAFSIPLRGTFNEIANQFSLQKFFSHDEITKFLADLGFVLISVQQTTYVQNFADTLSALRSIKLTGASYVAERLHHSLRGKEFILQTECTQLSYEIGYFIVEKSHE